MTNSQSKLAQEDDVGNRLVFLTDILYEVIQDRDVIRIVFKNLDDIESNEHRHYHKVVYDLENRKAHHSRCKLPTAIKCGIHLFRENYLQPKFYDKSYTVTEKIMLAKQIEKYRSWKYIRCKSELKRIRDSIKWQESFQSKWNYKLGGCLLMIKDNDKTHRPKWVFNRAESLTQGGHWTLGLKPGHTGRLIIEFIRTDYFGGMMSYLANDYRMYSSGFWYTPMPKRNLVEDYFVYLEEKPHGIIAR